MPRALKLYIAGLVGASALALTVTSLVFVPAPATSSGCGAVSVPVSGQGTDIGVLGVGFWTVITLCASAYPFRMPRGTLVSVSHRASSGCMILGGPVAAGWVAAWARPRSANSAAGSPGTDPSSIMLASSACDPRCLRLRGSSGRSTSPVTFVADDWSALYFGLNICWLRPASVIAAATRELRCN